MAIDFADLAVRVRYDDAVNATRALDDLAAAGARAEKATSDVGAGSDKASRQVGAWAQVNDEATKHTSGHALGITKVEHALESMLVHATGTNHVIGVIATSMLQFGVGGLVTVGVLAGLAAMAYVWDRYTDKIREAEKAQNDLTKSALAAFQTAALGPGGESANVATAAAGRIEDLKYQRDHIRDLTSTDRKLFESPEKATERIDQEIGQLQNLLRDAETRISVARAKEFAQSIVTPFDLAAARGQDILHFYGDAQVAQRQLNELAKSGNFETRQAALQGLQQMDQVLNRLKLQNLGLAEGPSRLLGLPSDVAIGGLRGTGGTLGAGIDAASRHGGDLADFQGQIETFVRRTTAALDEQGNKWTSVRVAAQAAVDQALLYSDALTMAGGGGEGFAARIRSRQQSNGALANVVSQTTYGQSLADREAALKLPAAFDAAREAAVDLGEGLRGAHQSLSKTLQSFNARNIGTGLQTGATGAINDALQQFTPGALAYQAVSAGINYIISGFTDMAKSMLDGGAAAEQYAREVKRTRDEYAASFASFQKNDLGAELANIALAADGLVQSLHDMNDTFTLVRGGASAINKAIADKAAIDAQEARNRALAEKQAVDKAGDALEDLVVRNLRATGRGSEADRQAFQEAQAREYRDAVDKAMIDGVLTLAEQTYLNTLRTTENNELLAFLNGTLQDATRNSPTGFFANSYYSSFATPRGGDDPFNTGMPPLNQPGTGASGSGLHPPGGTNNTGGSHGAPSGMTVNMVVDGRVVASAVVRQFDQHAGATGGAGTSRSDALNRYPA